MVDSLGHIGLTVWIIEHEAVELPSLQFLILKFSEGYGEEQVIDLSLLQTDPDKLYPLIYYAIKRKLKEWEQYMAERPGVSFSLPN